MMSIPVIGVTTGSNPEGAEIGDAAFAAYADAVSIAGGRPVYLDPGSDRDIAGLDGLLLTGGKDIHPRYYLEDEDADFKKLIVEKNMTMDEPRDEFEFAVTHAAYSAGIPIFGICRGFQLLNVALGGKLVMDIHTEIPHKADDESARHSVCVEPGSMLAELLGFGDVVVNSRHHQGATASDLAADLCPVALAADGMVEAVESRTHAWVLAVQWHPERIEDTYIYEPCKSIFEAFVRASC